MLPRLMKLPQRLLPKLMKLPQRLLPKLMKLPQRLLRLLPLSNRVILSQTKESLIVF